MKRFILSALTCFAVSCAFSQTFTNGVGVTVFVSSAQGSTSQAVGSITYSPRINFMENDTYAWSVGLPLSLGLSGSVNSQGTGNSSVDFVFNAPLVVNFNMGAGSTRDNDSRFGFFGGGGFGYLYATLNGYSTDYLGNPVSASVSSYGPVVDGGVRIGIGQSSHNIEIRGQFMKGIDASKANSFGIGALFNF